jgi:hypothetical protein
MREAIGRIGEFSGCLKGIVSDLFMEYMSEMHHE